MPQTDHRSSHPPTDGHGGDSPSTVCDSCGHVVPEHCIELTVSDCGICRVCRDAFYWRCGRCDGLNRLGRNCENDCCDPDGCDCDDCLDRLDDAAVHSYGYKPMPVFHGSGPLYLGVEIEVEMPYYRIDACATLATRQLGDLGYLKEDGSIGHGFEIVTHPMSYEWASAHFPWDVLGELAAAGCTVSEQTGIHVHLSRAGFSTCCHAYRWMKFIYRNEREVTRLAGRSSPQWAAFTSHDRRAVKDYAKGACGERYRAINACNAGTFEVRVFASSLDPAQLQAVLAFAAASVEYTRELSAHDIVTRNGWDWPMFVAWLHERPCYRPLLNRIKAPACAC